MKKIPAGKQIAFFVVMGMLILVSAMGIQYDAGKEAQAGEALSGEVLNEALNEVLYDVSNEVLYDVSNEVSADISDEVLIYPQGGFYEKDVKVQITVPKGAVVCYTLNCEEPDRERGEVYEAPILLTAGEAEQIYVLRAKVYYADGAESEVQTQTYFCGQGIRERYHTLVVSIAGEPDALLGYEEGILVPGRRYDAFREKNPDAHPGGGVEANYTMRGRDAEREVSIEIFDSEGRELVAQNGGIRVHGEASRLNDQKSLRLYARQEYGDNKFRYDFFDGLCSEVDGVLVDRYKHLDLGNGGQDYSYAFLRSALTEELAGRAGFPDTRHFEAACVYVNGDYYGVCWLINDFDQEYFQNRYGDYDGRFIVLGDKEKEKTTDEEDLQLFADTYNRRYSFLSSRDLASESAYEEVKQFMDLENYLQYMAIENYVGNMDWPANNVKVYRYEAGQTGYREGSVFDGRYRMLLYDLDYAFGLMFYRDTLGILVNETALSGLLEGDAPLFAALMEREDCRKYFVSYTLDLLNGAMRAENVADLADTLHAMQRPELEKMYAVEGMVGGLLLEEDKLNLSTVEWNVQRIKDFASQRPEYVLRDIEEEWGYGQQYQLTLASETEASSIKVNSVYGAMQGQEFTGIYLKEIPVMITPVPGPNEKFRGWLVDGQVWTEETLILGEAGDEDEMQIPGDGRFCVVQGDSVRIELLTTPVSEPVLRLKAVAAKGREDYVELVNLSQESVSTRGYYLSDREDLYQYALPVLTLGAGEEIHIVGRGNHSPDSLGQFALNFDLKDEEVLRLTYREEVLDEVTIPDLSADGVYVKDFQKGIFMEKKRGNG